MYIIICGGGKVGSYLARTFSQARHEVVVIEKLLEKCRRVADELPEILVINGDACDVKYLEQAGVDRADVVAAVSGNDDDNLVVCQLAKETFNVKRAVARINNPRNESIFQRLHIEAISSTIVIAKLIEEETKLGDIITLQAFKRGKLALIEVDLPLDSHIAGRHVMHLGFPKETVLVAIIRGEDVIIPRGDTVIQGGDQIMAVTSVAKEENLRKILTGKIAYKDACEL